MTSNSHGLTLSDTDWWEAYIFKEASPARGWESARRGRNVSSVLDECLIALEIIGQAYLPCVGAAAFLESSDL